jgi:hypothetical protein
MADMDVNASFLAHKEEKPKFAIPEDGWRQVVSPTPLSA